MRDYYSQMLEDQQARGRKPITFSSRTPMDWLNESAGTYLDKVAKHREAMNTAAVELKKSQDDLKAAQEANKTKLTIAERKRLVDEANMQLKSVLGGAKLGIEVTGSVDDEGNTSWEKKNLSPDQLPAPLAASTREKQLKGDYLEQVIKRWRVPDRYSYVTTWGNYVTENKDKLPPLGYVEAGMGANANKSREKSLQAYYPKTEGVTKTSYTKDGKMVSTTSDVLFRQMSPAGQEAVPVVDNIYNAALLDNERIETAQLELANMAILSGDQDVSNYCNASIAGLEEQKRVRNNTWTGPFTPKGTTPQAQPNPVTPEPEAEPESSNPYLDNGLKRLEQKRGK